MKKAVVGLFPTRTEAEGVVQDLVREGIPRDDISLVSRDEMERGETGGTQEGMGGIGTGAALGGLGGLLVGLAALAIPGIGPIVAAGPIATALGGAAIGAAAGGLIGALTDMGVPEEEARSYEEGVRRGGTLVTAHAEDAMADRARTIMERHHAMEVHGAAGTGRAEAASARTEAASGRTAAASVEAGQRRIPVGEEELQVGKREIDRGGVRVYSKVTERPVEEQVRLREERVNVERRPVDRAVEPGDRAFREETIEVRETAEEPVVAKQARIVEEVVIDKEVDERTETVRDTVRRKDVRVERAGGEEGLPYEGLESDFRQHCDRMHGASGVRYEQCAPAYRFGHSLASHPRYGGSDWSSVEPEARRHWEERNQGTWERFKDSVRYAWDRGRGQARAA
jgi:uncharacterized protein (TIGR02271 family)